TSGRVGLLPPPQAGEGTMWRCPRALFAPRVRHQYAQSALTTQAILSKLRRSRTTRQRAAEESCTERAASARETHGGCIMLKGRMTRRRFLATTAAATAIAMPYVRGAHASGKLTMGFWDHGVPGANNTTTALVNEWAEKEKVEVSIDYITSVGNKNLLTIAAESQAKSGHHIFGFA